MGQGPGNLVRLKPIGFSSLPVFPLFGYQMGLSRARMGLCAGGIETRKPCAAIVLKTGDAA